MPEFYPLTAPPKNAYKTWRKKKHTHTKLDVALKPSGKAWSLCDGNTMNV